MIDGLDKLTNRLDQISKGMDELSNTHSVPFSELFTNSFMQSHTNGKYSSFNDFLKPKFGDQIFSEIDDHELDLWVNQNTDFSSWKEMYKSSFHKYISKKF